MIDKFYRDFEERFYAPREVIRELRKQYLPFVKPVSEFYQGGSVYDIGCGRGEWLELMAEKGFASFGVDLDDGMLQDCRDLGLSAQKGDAVEYIKTLKDSSQVIVSAFHVVEHISFDKLQILIKESERVLKPGGLLILETPNPENFIVATKDFYLDPTHQRPIPPEFLSFLVEYNDFERVKLLRLQENKMLGNEGYLTLSDVMNGASVDYAVIAQKGGEQKLLDSISREFSVEYGRNFDCLADKYDQQVVHRIEKIEASVQRTVDAIESELKSTVDHAVESELKLQTVYRSRSWRITAPVRWVGLQLRLLREHGFVARIKSLGIKVVGLLTKRSVIFVNSRPILRTRALGLLRKLGLYGVIRSIYFRTTGSAVITDLSANENINREKDLNNLTPYARNIYDDLKAAIDEKRKENL